MDYQMHIAKNIQSIQRHIDDSEILSYIYSCYQDQSEPDSSYLIDRGYQQEEINIARDLIDIYLKFKSIIGGSTGEKTFNL
ncbi:MAG: hypothetical protein PHP06_06780 [Clostridia bacterium]|nr:hypothetical protein [Clostridia bacterium]